MKNTNPKDIILVGTAVKLVVCIFFTSIFTLYQDMKMNHLQVKVFDICLKVKKIREKVIKLRRHYWNKSNAFFFLKKRFSIDQLTKSYFFVEFTICLTFKDMLINRYLTYIVDKYLFRGDVFCTTIIIPI
jgi:hypothetical protein